MVKFKQIISDLATDLKSINLDDRLSYRYLASKFRDKISIFLRQDARSREVIKDNTIWQPINCIELEDAPHTTCGFVDNCNTIKRSIIKIPEAYSTNYGPLLKILTVDGVTEFTFIKSIEYSDYINRQYGPKPKVFWLENERIFIPNTTVDVVKGFILAKNPTLVDIINGDADKCTSPLDCMINYPDYLISLAKTEVVKELMGSKQVVEDEDPNDNTNAKQ